MKRLIISESEKNDIRKMYGLISEEYKDGMIPKRGYQIIDDIEMKMGRPHKVNDVWVPGPSDDNVPNYDAFQLETTIKGYINGCLSDEEWKKIDPLFRIQIYSFMFQAGSQPGQQYRWLAGLAQTINPKLDRSKIIGDENYRKSACATVNQAIKDGTINSYYEKYKEKLKEQYNGLTSTSKPADEWQANKDIAWNHRPDVIEDMYKTGKSISDIMGVYFDKDTKTNSFSTIKNKTDITTSRDVLYGKDKKTQPNQQTNNNNQQSTLQTGTLEINATKYDDLFQNIKEKTTDISIKKDSIDLDFNNMSFSVDYGTEKIKKIYLLMGRNADGKAYNVNFDERVASMKGKYNLEAVDQPSMCGDCWTHPDGTKSPIKYQLFISK